MTSGKADDKKKNERQDMGEKYALFWDVISVGPRLLRCTTFVREPVSSFPGTNWLARMIHDGSSENYPNARSS
jgi:hypothetical protein